MWLGATNRSITAPGAFTTSFPTVENPLSQGGIWLNGGTDGGSWTDVKVSSAVDGIHRACGATIVTGYNDGTAILKSSYRAFTANQYVETTVYIQSGYVPTGIYRECEHRLRSSLSSGLCTGYEVLFAYNDPAIKSDGFAVVRWNGAISDYTPLADFDGGIVPPIADGDRFRSQISGNIIKVYRWVSGAWSQIGTDVDITSQGGTVYSSGQPGIGFWPLDDGSGQSDQYGWRSVTIGNL